jgi:hypothetical protein
MGTFTYESIAYRFKNPSIDGNLDLLTDGAIIKIAADDDLQLTHSGSVGDITCSTGALDINAGTVNIKDEASSETMASFVSDGAVTINHDNSTVFNTVSGGCAVTGTLAVSSTSAFTGAITSNAGVIVDNITIDGTEIDLSSGNLTLDVDGDIFLDADGGDIFLRDGSSTTFGSLTNTSGNLIIKSGTTTAATFSGANVTFAGTLASGAITSSGDVTAFSDMRIKHDIETIEGALAKVSDMRGVYFKRNNGEAGTGVIAQEIENILPEVVKDGEYKSVAYGNMVGILIEAIKELKAEVEKLKESK